MPKVKTKKSVSKRFSVTKSGKVKRTNTKSRHLMTDYWVLPDLRKEYSYR